MARPQKDINWEEFEKLCGIQCTQGEIASFLGIHPETLRIRVAEKYGEDYPSVHKKYSDHGKCSLRRTQLKLAQRNAAMAIFLGKQWLDQTDNKDVDQSNQEFVKSFKSLMEQLGSLQSTRVDSNGSMPA